MNITLWIVQGLLAVFFGAGGAVKELRSQKRLYDQGLTWVEDLSPGAVKAIGAFEFAAAVGLVLPAVTGIAPVFVHSPPSGSA
jgi:DoxX-like family